MKKIILLSIFLLLPNFLFAGAARVYTYETGKIIDPAKVTANEDALFTWSQSEIDSYKDGSIINADISASAGITYGKLSLGSSILSTDIKDGEIVNADISSSAAIASSKIDLSSVDINGGTIDGVTIGGASAGATTVTTLNTGGKLTAGANEIEGSNFDITGGTMSGVNIGGMTATGELLVNDASDDATGLGSQGTSGQFLKSAGAGANPTWANAIPTQVNDTDAGTNFTANQTVTFLSVNKTITSGNTVMLIASGWVGAINTTGGVLINLKQGSTVVQTIGYQDTVTGDEKTWSACGIVTGLSGSVTFSVDVVSNGIAGTAYGNLVVLEF